MLWMHALKKQDEFSKTQLEKKKKARLPRCKPCIRESRLILFYYGPMSLNETMINASTDVPPEKKVSSKKSRDVQVSKFGLGETSN